MNFREKAFRYIQTGVICLQKNQTIIIYFFKDSMYLLIFLCKALKRKAPFFVFVKFQKEIHVNYLTYLKVLDFCQPEKCVHYLDEVDALDDVDADDEVEILDEVDTDDDVDTELEVETLKLNCCLIDFRKSSYLKVHFLIICFHLLVL